MKIPGMLYVNGKPIGEVTSLSIMPKGSNKFVPVADLLYGRESRQLSNPDQGAEQSAREKLMTSAATIRMTIP